MIDNSISLGATPRKTSSTVADTSTVTTGITDTNKQAPSLPAMESEPSTHSSQPTYEEIRRIITTSGGLFVGIEELAQYDHSMRIGTPPPLPPACTTEFLQSPHPLRKELIASHVILGLDFDPDTKTLAWCMIDRGTGGTTDIIPGSLGPDGKGLPGHLQDQLLKVDDIWLSARGVSLVPPVNSFPIERVLNHAIRVHLQSGNTLETAPFFNIWARTGDTERGTLNSRALLGMAKRPGILNQCFTRGSVASRYVGLLGEWKFPESDTSTTLNTGATRRGP